MYLFGELLRVVNKHPTYAAIPPDKDLKLLRASYNITVITMFHSSPIYLSKNVSPLLLSLGYGCFNDF